MGKETQPDDKITAWLQERGLTREDLEEAGGCLDEAERLGKTGRLGWNRKEGVKDLSE